MTGSMSLFIPNSIKAQFQMSSPEWISTDALQQFSSMMQTTTVRTILSPVLEIKLRSAQACVGRLRTHSLHRGKFRTGPLTRSSRWFAQLTSLSWTQTTWRGCRRCPRYQNCLLKMSSSNDEKKISRLSVVSIVFGVLADWNIIVLKSLSYVLILPSGDACFARVEKAKRFQSPKSLSDGTVKGYLIKMKRNMCPKRMLAESTVPWKTYPSLYSYVPLPCWKMLCSIAQHPQWLRRRSPHAAFPRVHRQIINST